MGPSPFERVERRSRRVSSALKPEAKNELAAPLAHFENAAKQNVGTARTVIP